MNSNDRTDYLKKYNLFNIILVLWILFLPLKNSVYQGSVVLIIIMFFYHLTSFKTYNFIKELILEYKDILTAFSLIILSMVLSSIAGINTIESLEETLKFFIRYLLVFFILIYFYRLEFFSKKFILSTIILTLSLYGLDGIYQYYYGLDFFKNLPLEGNALTGPFFSKNILGFIMAIGAIVTFSLIMENKFNMTIALILYLIFFIFIFNLAFSLSRASWLFFVISAGLMTIAAIKTIKFNFKHISFLILSIIFLALFFIFNDVLLARLDSLISLDSAHRTDIWLDTLSHIREKIFLGYGIDTFSLVVRQDHSGVHNSTLEILLFLGIVGLAVYINLFRVVFQKIIKDKLIYYGSFLVGFLFLLHFDGSLVYSKLDLSVLIILLFFIYGKKENKIES